MSFLTEVFVAFVLDLGNVLQIVSAPGQQIIRPQGSMVMQTVPQAVPASNPSATSAPHPGLPTSQQGEVVKVSILLSNYSRQCFLSPIKDVQYSRYIMYDHLTFTSVLMLFLKNIYIFFLKE